MNMRPEVLPIPHGALLGHKVRTPDGVGFLISITTESNGLYVVTDRCQCTVWYGMDAVQAGKVCWTYSSDEITALENELGEELRFEPRRIVEV